MAVGCKVMVHDPETAEDKAITVPSRVGCVWPCADSARLVCGFYITSARIDLDEAALERQPFAGGLFKIDAGVSGLGAVPFIVD